MKIAIVNDQKKIVEGLAEILTSILHFEIIWIAHNGKESVQKSKDDPPDLILMDINMPVMDGVEATRLIMKNHPVAILIVTLDKETTTSKIFEAMGYGALDVFTLKQFKIASDPLGVKDFLDKIQVIGRLIGKKCEIRQKSVYKEIPSKRTDQISLLVIGASTGGPAALTKILKDLPERNNFTIIIIQHVDSKFAPGFVHWLAKQTGLPVKIAEAGPIPSSGVFVAGQNRHLVMTPSCELKYIDRPENTPFKPSVDIFFHSVAQNWPRKFVGVLLTGMGSDGALGLKALKESGWYTIAEHKKSCVVYGMPKAAVEINAAVAVLEINDIASSIVSYLDDQS